MTTLQSALLLVFYELLLSSGDYELQVAIHFLSNPGRISANGYCCDGCSGAFVQCEYFFYICQRPAGSPVSTVTEENQGNCSAERTQVYRVDNGTQIPFEPALKFLATGNEWLQQQDVNSMNPVKFAYGPLFSKDHHGHLVECNFVHHTVNHRDCCYRLVTEGVQVFIDLVDDDDNRNDNDLVDRFAINVTQSVGSSTRNRYSGIFSTAELIISLTLQCTGTYDCGKFCNESCEAMLRIKIHSFSVPEGRCADIQCSSESCCDSICPQNQCQYHLLYCRGPTVSYEQAKYQGNCLAVNLTFENQTLSLSRKLALPLMQLAPQEIQLFIEQMHFSRDNEVNVLIERFIVNIYTEQRVINFYSGIFGLANISMTTEIICRPELDHCILNEDLDECTNSAHNCDQNCENTVGGFECTCNEGYTLEDNSCIAVQTFSGSVELSVGVVGSLVLLLGIIITFIFIVRRRRKAQKTTDSPVEHDSNDIAFNLGAFVEPVIAAEKKQQLPNFQHLTVQSTLKHNISKSLTINSCNLQLGAILGQGEFGVVYKGYLKHGYSNTLNETVAIKTLKGFVQEDTISQLLKECIKMQDFNHPNVLKLIGVCLDGGPAPFIVMPFMSNGSLNVYAQKERKNLVLEETDLLQQEDIDAIERKLLDMCIQVAKGMEYLSSKKIVHRDLAARNCMMDVNFIIKVADFGLAESIDTFKEYFRQNQDNAIKLPIKWMALESINNGMFSEKSDVWSFGVTCWEIFSGGMTPYPGIHPVDLPKKLSDGLRLDKPANAACKKDMFCIMLCCWELKYEKRPSFTDLVNQLTSQLAAKACYIDFVAPTR